MLNEELENCKTICVNLDNHAKELERQNSELIAELE